MRCFKCGGQLEANDVFCMNCGTKVASQNMSEATMPMQHTLAGFGSQLCSSCNKPIEPGDLFCMNCGTKTAPASPAIPALMPVMPAIPAPTMQSNQLCGTCGSSIEAGDLFCMNCGTKTAPPQAQAAPIQPAPIPSPPPPPIQRTPVKIPPAPVTSPPPTAAAPPVAQAQPVILPPMPANHTANANRMNLVFLLDTSESSRDYIAGLNTGINNFKSKVLGDAHTASLLDTSVIVFSSGVTERQLLAPINSMMPLKLTAGSVANFTPPIQDAMQYFSGMSTPAAYKPWVILISTATPQDDISSVASSIKSLQDADKLRMLALSVGGTNAAYLKALTDVVLWLDGTDFTPFFTWVAKCMSSISTTAPGAKPKLPELENNLYRAK